MQTIAAFERALLDGGAGRTLSPADAGPVKRDYMLLLALLAELRVGEPPPPVLAAADLSECRCNRCSQDWATVCCRDCATEHALLCRECSLEIHQGRWASHDTLEFADSPTQARMHSIITLLETSSDVLAARCGNPTSSNDVATHVATHVDVVRVLAHRQDEHAVRCMRATVPDYDSGGVAAEALRRGAVTAVRSQVH